MNWGIISIDSTFIKDFIRDGMVGKNFFFNCILQNPNKALILLYMWPTNMKLMKTSQKIFLAIRRDQNAKTNLFLMFHVALSIWTFKIGGNGITRIGTSSTSQNKDLHMFTPYKIARNKGAKPNPTNNLWEEYFGGNSRSHKSFAKDSTI